MDRVRKISVEICGRNEDLGNVKENGGFLSIFVSRLFLRNFGVLKDPENINSNLRFSGYKV